MTQTQNIKLGQAGDLSYYVTADDEVVQDGIENLAVAQFLVRAAKAGEDSRNMSTLLLGVARANRKATAKAPLGKTRKAH